MSDFHKSFSSWLWHTSLCLENPWSPSPTSSQWRTSRPSLGTRPRRGRELIFVVLSIVLRGRVSPVAGLNICVLCCPGLAWSSGSLYFLLLPEHPSQPLHTRVWCFYQPRHHHDPFLQVNHHQVSAASPPLSDRGAWTSVWACDLPTGLILFCVERRAGITPVHTSWLARF